MQLENKFLCHWDFCRFVPEEYLLDDNELPLTLSVIDSYKTELMIFLGKADSGSGYEVRVYKAKPTDTYIPYKYDNVSRYEENYEYATFFFTDYDHANDFIVMLGYVHSEYRVRPVNNQS